MGILAVLIGAIFALIVVHAVGGKPGAPAADCGRFAEQSTGFGFAICWWKTLALAACVLCPFRSISIFILIPLMAFFHSSSLRQAWLRCLWLAAMLTFCTLIFKARRHHGVVAIDPFAEIRHEWVAGRWRSCCFRLRLSALQARLLSLTVRCGPTCLRAI